MPRATVESVVDYQVDGDAVRLDCETVYDDPPGEYALPDGRHPIEIRFFAPDVFRFELLGSPEVDPAPTGNLSPENLTESVDLRVEESGDRLTISTDRLRIDVGLSEWSFTVYSEDGTELVREQRADHNTKGERHTHPLGFTASRVNRWPYRHTACGTAFTLGPDEHVYGLGEKFTTFDKRGQTIDSWVTQANGTLSEAAYKNVPFYLSSAGYGLLVDTNRKTTFDVADSSYATLSVSVADDTFAFVCFGSESYPEIIRKYTALTGRPPRVPKWSFGLWMSRCTYQSRAEVEHVVTEMDERDIPCDVVHLDPSYLTGLCTLEWDRDDFPDPEAFVQWLHDRDVRVSLWEYPYLLSETDTFDEARDEGYLVGDGTGKPYLLSRLSWSEDRGGIVDFTDPDAVEWWAEKHAPLIEMGVDVFKTDFGEYLPEDAVLANGRNGASMRNPYPNLFTRTVYETFEDAVGEEALIWARSGWIGGQQYPVHWGGDPNTSFAAMAASLTGGLSLCMSGYGYWSADIGGFRGEPTTELYARWAGFGLLGMSHARFHGTTPREPWHYGPEAVDAVRNLARERYRIVPYLYTMAEHTSREGLPVMRPLVLEFPDDPTAQTEQTELMLGDSLLVAPVLEPGGERDVYLPEGEWIDYWSGHRLDGQRLIHRDVPLDEVPVFLRAGSVVPRQPPSEGVSPGMPADLELYGALHEGAASGTVLDEETDELVEVSVERDGDTVVVEAGAIDVDTVTLAAVADEPSSVRVDGDELTRRETDARPGEWQTDGDALVIRP
jgi:alpha-D-xyloside xylohydrolase